MLMFQATIVRRVHTSHYIESHSETQRSYLEWKAKIWGPWAKEIIQVLDRRSYQQVCMSTCSHADLNPWQEMFYADHHKGWKRLVPQVVDLVDDFALTIWYLDDGNVGKWPGVTFEADEKSREVAFAIFEKFNLRPCWQLHKGTAGAFHMEGEDTAFKFVDIIRPHVPSCMDYKLGPFGFQGPHYQVRQKLDESKLREMAGKGIPIRQIARVLGVGATTVDHWLVEHDVSHPRTIGQPRKAVLSSPVEAESADGGSIGAGDDSIGSDNGNP